MRKRRIVIGFQTFELNLIRNQIGHNQNGLAFQFTVSSFNCVTVHRYYAFVKIELRINLRVEKAIPVDREESIGVSEAANLSQEIRTKIKARYSKLHSKSTSDSNIHRRMQSTYNSTPSEHNNALKRVKHSCLKGKGRTLFIKVVRKAIKWFLSQVFGVSTC